MPPMIRNFPRPEHAHGGRNARRCDSLFSALPLRTLRLSVKQRRYPAVTPGLVWGRWVLVIFLLKIGGDEGFGGEISHGVMKS